MADAKDTPKPKRKRTSRKKAPRRKKAGAKFEELAARVGDADDDLLTLASDVAPVAASAAAEASVDVPKKRVGPKPKPAPKPKVVDRLEGIPPYKGALPWRSHVTVMEIVLDVLKPKRIVEVGCGAYSTLPLLDAIVGASSLFIIEPIADWASWARSVEGTRVVNNLGSVSAEEWAGADLVFIDGPRETRAPAIRIAARHGAKTIVVHDADKAAYYGIPRILAGYETRLHLQRECGKGTRIYTQIPGLIRTVRTRCLDHRSIA